MISAGLRRATALAGCVLMGGCGTLLDPYVKVQDVHLTDASILSESGWKKAQDLLLAEHKSAQDQADAYRGGAKDQAQFKTGLALGLPLLNAAALGFASAHDRSDFVPVVGFGSAAALSVGGLLSSPARQAIYLQAQTATLCSMAAYDVFLINEGDYNNYLADNSALKTDIDAVKTAQRRLTEEFAGYKATMDGAVASTKAAEQKVAAAAAAGAAKPPAAKPSAAKPPAVAPSKPGAAAPPNAQDTGKDSADVAYGGTAQVRKPYTATPSPPAPAKPKPHRAAPIKLAARKKVTPPVAPSPSSADLETLENGVKALADASAASADDAITAATTTQASLQAARERVDEAGRSLGAHRMAIKAQVDQNIQTTEITLDQIRAAISASALASTQATPSAPKAATSDTGTGGSAKAQGASLSVQTELDRDASRVNVAMRRLDDAVAALNRDKALADAWLQRELKKEQDATQVGTCTASAQVVLTATPDNPAEVSGSKSLKIQIHAPTTGGAPTYTKVEDNLTETMTTGGGYDYTLTIAESGSTKPATKDQSVVISSGSQSVTVKFSVTDAVIPKGTDSTTAPAAADAATWASSDWQDVLGFDDQGKKDWPTALKTYAKRQGVTTPMTADGKGPSDDVNKVEAQATAIIASSGKMSPYEKAWVSDAHMTALKKALSVDASNTKLDDATRTAISTVDKHGGKSVTTDVLATLKMPDPTAPSS